MTPSDLPWHDYAGESPSELLAMIGRVRPDALVVAFETAVMRKEHALGVASLSRVERDVLVVEAVENEVNNGGYIQFFGNHSHVYAGEAVDALTRVGCPAAAALTARAIAALPPHDRLDPAFFASLDEGDEDMREALDACDEAYYVAAEPIAERLLDYLARHREQVDWPAGLPPYPM